VGIVSSHGGDTGGVRSGRTVMSSGEGYVCSDGSSGGGGSGYGGMSGGGQAIRPNTLPASGESHGGSFKTSQFTPPGNYKHFQYYIRCKMSINFYLLQRFLPSIFKIFKNS